MGQCPRTRIISVLVKMKNYGSKLELAKSNFKQKISLNTLHF